MLISYIPELGNLLLILAFSYGLCTNVAHSIAPRHNLHQASLVVTTLLLAAMAILIYSFYSNDYSVHYVAQHSHTALPLIYKLCAMWGGHAGSLLLWVTLISIVNSLTGYHELHKVMLWIITIFLGYIIFLANPFARDIWHASFTGQNLNPLLQDPLFVLHPPILYSSYALITLAFAAALQLLITNYDQNMLQLLRRITLLAWSTLTCAIMLGSFWAYYELGWGGYWFWDPVENASFMPWLLLTATIHAVPLTKRLPWMLTWCVLLPIMTFILTLIGTFLVRSGILISVHAFAADPLLGAYLLAFISIVIIITIIYYYRHNTVSFTKQKIDFCSKELLVLANIWLLIIATACILLGTTYPLILDAVLGQTIAIGAPYFNQIILPIFIVQLVLLSLLGSYKWQHTAASIIWQQIKFILLGIIAITILYRCFAMHFHNILLWCSNLLAIMVIIAIVYHICTATKRSKSYFGMQFAHAGVAIIAIAITINNNWQQRYELRMQLHDTLTIAQQKLTFTKLQIHETELTTAITANFALTNDARHTVPYILAPKLIRYPGTNQLVAETAIYSTWWYDIYIALAENYADDSWGVRIYYNPGMRLLWCGGMLLVIAGIWTLIVRFTQQRQIQPTRII